MTDVEMSSLTPPSHRISNLEAPVGGQNEELADESMSNEDTHTQNVSSKAARVDLTGAPSQHVRRKRSVLSRKGKRLAHLQSRELATVSRGLTSNGGDDTGNDSYGTEDEDDGEEDGDEQRRDGTPSRIRSITKYAVNYILPNAVSPLPHPSPSSPPGSAVHHLDKPELLLGYAQFIFNASILLTFLYLLYHVVRTVQKDVAEKVRAYEMGEYSLHSVPLLCGWICEPRLTT